MAEHCLTHAITAQEVIELLKQSFVTAATRKLEQEGVKLNTMRISAATGLARREVQRLKDGVPAKRPRVGIPGKLIARWLDDPNYQNKVGEPKKLTYKGAKSEFHQLVHQLSLDISPTSLLTSLLSSGVVNSTDKGTIELVSLGYVPAHNIDEILHLCSSDFDDTIAMLLQNISDPSFPHLHATTVFDAIDSSQVKKIKKWLLREGTKFHNKVRRHLTKYDDDKLPSEKKSRVVVNSFSFTE